MVTSRESDAPRDAQTIRAILSSMGVEEYDELVVRQLLEVLYRYVWSVLDDARSYSEHADKPAIDVEDVKLAIRTRVEMSFTQPPSREVTMRAAMAQNSEALPPVDLHAGVALPAIEQTLMRQNIAVLLSDKPEGTDKPKERDNENGRERAEASLNISDSGKDGNRTSKEPDGDTVMQEEETTRGNDTNVATGATTMSPKPKDVGTPGDSTARGEPTTPASGGEKVQGADNEKPTRSEAAEVGEPKNASATDAKEDIVPMETGSGSSKQPGNQATAPDGTPPTASDGSQINDASLGGNETAESGANSGPEKGTSTTLPDVSLSKPELPDSSATETLKMEVSSDPATLSGSPAATDQLLQKVEPTLQSPIVDAAQGTLPGTEPMAGAHADTTAKTEAAKETGGLNVPPKPEAEIANPTTSDGESRGVPDGSQPTT